MAHFAPMAPNEMILEQAADTLLNAAPTDPVRPAYTEGQLSRRARREVHTSALLDNVICTPQELRDELKFLISITTLQPELRRCLQLWIDGWTQTEIAEAYSIPQQVVSRRIRAALRKCYDSAPLCFRLYSRHTIYRKPGRADPQLVRRCLHCETSFHLGAGIGRYCSLACQQAAQHERA